MFNGTGSEREEMQSDVLKDISLYDRACREQMNRRAPCNLVWRSFLTLSILLLSFICLCHTACTHVLWFLHCSLHSSSVLFCHTAVSVYFLPPYGCVLPRRWLLYQHHMARPTRQAALRKTLTASPLSMFPLRDPVKHLHGVITVYRKYTYKLI